MVLTLSYVAVLPMLLPLSLAQHIILVGDGTTWSNSLMPSLQATSLNVQHMLLAATSPASRAYQGTLPIWASLLSRWSPMESSM